MIKVLIKNRVTSSSRIRTTARVKVKTRGSKVVYDMGKFAQIPDLGNYPVMTSDVPVDGINDVVFTVPLGRYAFGKIIPNYNGANDPKFTQVDPATGKWKWNFIPDADSVSTAQYYDV